MRHHLALVTAASAIAFASKPAPAAKKTEAETAPAPTPAAAPAKGDRVAPTFGEIRTNVEMPTTAPRGSKSAYADKFAALAIVGASFGVTNKTAAQLHPVVSRENRKNLVDKRDEAGAIVYKTKQIANQDGTKSTVNTTEPEKVAGKKFVVFDVDPKTDPDGATARVFRKL